MKHHQKEQTSDIHALQDVGHRQPIGRRLAVESSLVFFVAVLIFFYSFNWNTLGQSPVAKTSFKWEDIIPQRHLVYYPCFDGFQCARLEVPMDWNRTDGKGSKIALAVIKIPAKVPVTDKRYGGAIVTNPGGPGGSGVNDVLVQGKTFQAIVDSEKQPDNVSIGSGKYFDIIGFDPRGVNNTTPNFSCFENAMTRRTWQLQAHAEGVINSSDSALDILWARYEALSMSCSQPNGLDQEWIGHHMNTAPVVADIIELIERHGEWRENETHNLLEKSKSAPEKKLISLRNKWHRSQERLLYWGFSYGSVLGTTLASMHPGRISRMVVDGICDVPDYYRGGWLFNLQDTDIIFDKFCEYCHEAGPTLCPLASDSPSRIKSHIQNLLENLRTNPCPVPGTRNRGPDIITYSDVRQLMKLSVYSPMARFQDMAQFLFDLLHHNCSLFANYKHSSGLWPNPPCHPVDSCPSSDNTGEVSQSILCTDGSAANNVVTKQEFRKYVQTLQGQSKLLGDLWAEIALSCISWKAKPSWLFNGPIGGNTSHQLLFIGNKYDPVTPLRNAFAMAHEFPGSAVLQQNSVGHCTYSMPSSCTAAVIRRYFDTGDLPAPGTICEPDERPFGLPGVRAA